MYLSGLFTQTRDDPDFPLRALVVSRSVLGEYRLAYLLILIRMGVQSAYRLVLSPIFRWNKGLCFRSSSCPLIDYRCSYFLFSGRCMDFIKVVECTTNPRAISLVYPDLLSKDQA